MWVFLGQMCLKRGPLVIENIVLKSDGEFFYQKAPSSLGIYHWSLSSKLVHVFAVMLTSALFLSIFSKIWLILLFALNLTNTCALVYTGVSQYNFYINKAFHVKTVWAFRSLGIESIKTPKFKQSVNLKCRMS